MTSDIEHIFVYVLAISMSSLGKSLFGSFAHFINKIRLIGYWSRKWQPTPVFLPGESQGWGSLVGCCLWGCTESATTEAP